MVETKDLSRSHCRGFNPLHLILSQIKKYIQIFFCKFHVFFFDGYLCFYDYFMGFDKYKRECNLIVFLFGWDCESEVICIGGCFF